MALAINRQGNRFQYRHIPDDKLAEGRISLPLSLEFDPVNDGSGGPFNLPINPHGALQKYVFDARTFQGVTNFTSFKSVDFFAQFEIFSLLDPRAYLYSPDSGDFHAMIPVPPSADPAGLMSFAYVAGTFPIVSNASSIEIYAEFGSNVANGSNTQLAFVFNNFAKAPYVYQSPSADVINT